MNGAPSPAARLELAERYVARIAAHLVRFADGHDPMGHLYAIERLARVARIEWWEAQRQTQPGRHGRWGS
jgi:hypothetical protein